VTFQIRAAEPGDIAAIRGFGRRVVAPHYASIGLPEFGDANYWDSESQVVAVDERRVFLATDDAAIVGERASVKRASIESSNMHRRTRSPS
jgi:hypothetical protein